ncbi:hypothetical protein SDC9_57881 [bioreactor metagenome]|uniref:Uncharacterized protein n=1 Tax=bioreactor metagenome TaxID=1076179 RepID=A0A644X5X3_9ZZZZ
MQVEVHHVEAHVAGTRGAHDGVHVRAVIVAEPTRVVDDSGGFKDVAVEYAERVGVCEHQARRFLPDGVFQRAEIHRAIRRGGDVDHRKARHRSRSGVGSMRGIRHDNLPSRVISVRLMIRLDEKQTQQFSVRARRRLEGHFIHADEFIKQFRRFRQHFQAPLHGLHRLKRMNGGKAFQRRRLLVDGGVVFHGA